MEERALEGVLAEWMLEEQALLDALEERALEGALEERSWPRPVKMKENWKEDQVSFLGSMGN